MYYISFDGEHKLPAGENLAFATELFERSVRNGDWCPALVDDEGVVLISWDNSNYEWSELRVIGPQFDEEWYRHHEGTDRIAEEHDYKFGEWRL
jgi:hypothetical protein